MVTINIETEREIILKKEDTPTLFVSDTMYNDWDEFSILQVLCR